MFEIKCLKCGEMVIFKNGKNDESKIEVTGAVEVMFNPEVFLECKCGNQITIEK